MPQRSSSRAPPRGRATTRESQPPTRTCIGCGRRAPKDELERWASVEGVLMPGRTLPGRGAYTCCDRSCFQQAIERRAFARALRARVAIEALYTGASNG